MSLETGKEINRIDKLDKKADKKISLIKGREEELTHTYIAKTENLLRNLELIENEKTREKAKEKIAAKLFTIDEKNLAERKGEFDERIDKWILETEKALTGQSLKKEKEKNKESFLLKKARDDETASVKAMELADEIEKELEPYKNYLEITKTGTSLDVAYKDSFFDLEIEEQTEIQKLISSISMKTVLKKEESLVEAETREWIKKFYEANKKLNEGNYIQAKSLYKQFLEGHEKVKSKDNEYIDASDEYNAQRAIESLKLIAKQESTFAETRLHAIEKSIESYSMNMFPTLKFGCSKAHAQNAIKSQKTILELANKLIETDANILTFEDAVKSVLGKGSEEFTEDGKNDNVIDRRLKFYREKFTGNVEKIYIPSLDAINAIITENGDISVESLDKIAKEYRKTGMYDAAEQMYDFNFRNSYKRFAVGQLDKETYIENFKKNPEKIEKIKSQIAQQEQQMEKQENKVFSPEEREIVMRSIIEREWKNDLRMRITEQAKNGKLDPETAEKWKEFNDDYLQIDRSWYELFKFTAKEWDSFLETLPIDIASLILTAGAANLVGKAVTTAVAKKLLVQRLAELGIKEAFKKGGKKAAMKALGAKFSGFLAESLAFSEISMFQTALRQGDFSTMMNFDEHKKNLGHSILTLGSLRATNTILNKIPLTKLGQALSTPFVDTAVLTGQTVILDSSIAGSDIAVMARHNLVLSIGIRAGHKTADYPAKTMQKFKQMKASGEETTGFKERLGKAHDAFKKELAEPNLYSMFPAAPFKKAYKAFDKGRLTPEKLIGQAGQFKIGQRIDMINNDGSPIKGEIVRIQPLNDGDSAIYIKEGNVEIPYSGNFLSNKIKALNIKNEPTQNVKEYLEKAKADPNQLSITKEILENPNVPFELGAVHNIDGKKFLIGKPVYDPTAERFYSIVFVEQGGRLIPRFFYKSQSGGTWRSSPYINTQKGIYGKGLKDHQRHSYSQETQPHETIESALENMLSASRKGAYESIFDFHFDLNKMEKNNINTYKKETDYPIKSSLYDGNIPKELSSWRKSNPSLSAVVEGVNNIEYPQGFIPDFSKGPVESFKTNHSILGGTINEIFTAKLDGRPVEWRMSYDATGKVWVQSIKFADSSINSYGINSEVISPGILTQKPFEYSKQLPYSLNQSYHIVQKGNGIYSDVTPLLDALTPIREFRAARNIYRK